MRCRPGAWLPGGQPGAAHTPLSRPARQARQRGSWMDCPWARRTRLQSTTRVGLGRGLGLGISGLVGRPGPALRRWYRSRSFARQRFRREFVIASRHSGHSLKVKSELCLCTRHNFAGSAGFQAADPKLVILCCRRSGSPHNLQGIRSSRGPPHLPALGGPSGAAVVLGGGGAAVAAPGTAMQRVLSTKESRV